MFGEKMISGAERKEPADTTEKRLKAIEDSQAMAFKFCQHQLEAEGNIFAFAIIDSEDTTFFCPMATETVNKQFEFIGAIAKATHAFSAIFCSEAWMCQGENFANKDKIDELYEKYGSIGNFPAEWRKEIVQISTRRYNESLFINNSGYTATIYNLVRDTEGNYVQLEHDEKISGVMAEESAHPEGRMVDGMKKQVGDNDISGIIEGPYGDDSGDVE